MTVCLLWNGKHQHPELALRRSIPRLRPTLSPIHVCPREQPVHHSGPVRFATLAQTANVPSMSCRYQIPCGGSGSWNESEFRRLAWGMPENPNPFADFDLE